MVSRWRASGVPAGTLRRILRLTWPHRWAFTLAVAASGVALAAGLLTPVLVQRVIDGAVLGRDRSLLWPLGLGILGLGVVRAAANLARFMLSGTSGARVEADLRSLSFARLQRLAPSSTARWDRGQILSRLTSDLHAIRTFIGFPLVFLAFSVITLVSVATMLLASDVPLGLLTLGLMVPYSLVALLFNGRMVPTVIRSREIQGEVTESVQESTAGIRVVKGLGRERQRIHALVELSDRLRTTNNEGIKIRSRYIPALGLMTNLALAAVLGFGGLQVIEHRMSLGQLVAFNHYLALLLLPLRHLGWYLATGQHAVVAAARVFEILDAEPSVVDHPRSRPLEAGRADVVFEDVSFVYPGAAQSALDRVSFTVERGQVVAVVGGSGSGKSTLAALIPRFLEPTAGRVLIGGSDTREVTLSTLRARVGVVFDDPVLFSGSIRENIIFGRTRIEDAAVERAARAAGAHDFVVDLPSGYFTEVGEEGFLLSGGQRQRLALARALLGEPEVLVLDDPLSNVDVHTETEVIRRTLAARRGRTTILISRRPSTVAMVDLVVVLDGGRVITTGSHAELLADPTYRHLFAPAMAGDVNASQ